MGIDQTNPAFAGQARDWFDGMAPSQRVAYVQRVLLADGYYDGPDSGQLDERTRDAIARYQADNDLIATGRVDFDLYQRMLAQPSGQKGTDKGPGAPRLQSVSNAGGEGLPRAAPPPAGAAPDLVLGSDRGPQPRYRAGETLVVRVQPTANGFVYCYYQDAAGAVARIFPNRFQPDSFVQANQQIEVPPGAQKPFNLRMDRPGAAETIACVVSPDEIGTRIAERFKIEDLQPIPGATLADVLGAYASIQGTSVRSRQMAVQVLPAVSAQR